MRWQRGPTESVVLNMPCAHIRSRRSWLRAYGLALICRPSASSAAPQALQGSLSFSCATGGSHLRLRLDEPPPAICLSSSGLSNSARCARGVETQTPLPDGRRGRRSISNSLCSALGARAVRFAQLGSPFATEGSLVNNSSFGIRISYLTHAHSSWVRIPLINLVNKKSNPSGDELLFLFKSG